jgi:hypothetical protein
MSRLLITLLLLVIVFSKVSSASPLIDMCTKELIAKRGFKSESLKVSEVSNLKPSKISSYVDRKANDGSMMDPSQMFMSSGKGKKSPMEQVAEAMYLADKHPQSTFVAFHLFGETSDGKKLKICLL